MDDSQFEQERRRLRRERDEEIERVRAAYRRRLEAIDRAEELMSFATTGDAEAETAGETLAEMPERAPQPPSQLRRDLRRFVAGLSEPFTTDDVRARFPGASSESVRTCLAQMAQDGEVRIVEPGHPGQPTRYETPEPDYALIAAEVQGGATSD